jgi:hypothetical protein
MSFAPTPGRANAAGRPPSGLAPGLRVSLWPSRLNIRGAGAQALPLGRALADAPGQWWIARDAFRSATTASYPGHPQIVVIGDLRCSPPSTPRP